MANISEITTSAVNALGTNFLIGYYTPATLFWVTNIFVAKRLCGSPPSESLLCYPTVVTDKLDDATFASLIVLLLIPLFVGLILFAINDLLIRAFEGEPRWLGEGLLASWTARNRKRNHQLYGELNKLRAKSQGLYIDSQLKGASAEKVKLFFAARQATVKEYEDAANKAPIRTLPYNPDLVRPTRFGNLYAMAEEYPFESYGIDSVLFWPRLWVLMTEKASNQVQQISAQKSRVDLTVNLAFVTALLFLESIIGLVATFSSANLLGWLAALVGSVGLFSLFYKASVTNLVGLGELIKSSYDYHRYLILASFQIEPPKSLAAEHLIWQNLATFLRRSDFIYLESARHIGETMAQSQPVNANNASKVEQRQTQ